MSAAPEAGPVRLILTLGVAGLLSGLALVGIYEVTLPRIQANHAAALQKAVFQVLPGTASFKRLAWDGSSLVEDESAPTDQAIFAGYDAGGALTGFAMPGAGPGFQDTIRVLYGFDPVKQRIVGFQVLESRETPGLGDKIFKDAAFQENFRSLAVAPEIKLVKTGARSADNEVDGITGATISSKAITRILNNTNTTWLERLPTYAPSQPAEGGR